jgi:competence protein ComEC
MTKTAKILFLLLWAPSWLLARSLDFYFIDAELGNATLIISPSGQSLLIDGGHAGDNNRDANRVLTAIRAAGLKQIDYLVVTHYHGDHYGAVPEVARHIRIVNWIDHGPAVEFGRNAEWQQRWGKGDEALFREYQAERSKAHHIVIQAGDRIPIKGMDVRVLSSAGKQISMPVPGAGSPNPACLTADTRLEDESEDGQSISLLITFGKFRFVNLSDLTWNNTNRLFCPNNLVGNVDLYLTTHHGMSMDKNTPQAVNWSRSCCTGPEMSGLRPRVAILNAGEHYHRNGTPHGWQAVRNSPGLVDLWQLHYQVQGGPDNNVDEKFITNLSEQRDKGYGIRVSAFSDGGFTVINDRNGFQKRYPPKP